MSNLKVSGWEKAATLAAYLEVIVVTISLCFISSQLQQQKLQLEQQVKLTQAANTQALVELATPLALRATEQDMAEVLAKGDHSPNASALKEQIQWDRYQTFVLSYLDFYENAYSQCREGLLNQEIYHGWDNDLGYFIAGNNIAKYWENWRELYRPDFRGHVSQIIASQSADEPLPIVVCK